MSYFSDRVDLIEVPRHIPQIELRDWGRQKLSAAYYFSEREFWPKPLTGDRKFVREEIRFVTNDGKELVRYTQLDLIRDTGLLLVGHGNS
jgi:hypothetical protein